tara:strand:+ start:74 stop:1063 length:990 start_codon:yes stop_codon:yes gene_type:complete
MDTRQQQTNDQQNPAEQEDDLTNYGDLDCLGTQILLLCFVKEMVDNDFSSAMNLSLTNKSFQQLFKNAMLAKKLLALVIDADRLHENLKNNLARIEQFIQIYPEIMFQHAQVKAFDDRVISTSPLKYILSTGDVYLLELFLEAAESSGHLDYFVSQCSEQIRDADITAQQNLYLSYFDLLNERADNPNDINAKINKMNNFTTSTISSGQRNMPRWMLDAKFRCNKAESLNKAFDDTKPPEAYTVYDPSRRGDINVLMFAKNNELGKDFALTNGNNGELIATRHCLSYQEADNDLSEWSSLFNQGLSKQKAILANAKDKLDHQKTDKSTK